MRTQKGKLNPIYLKNCLLAFSIMFIAYFGMAMPEWVISADWGSEFRPSALEQSLMGIFFGGIMLLTPLCASVTSGVLQCDEVHSSILDWKLLRSSVKKYSARQLTYSFFRGGICIAGAFAVNAILWNLIALPCDIVKHPYHELPFADDCLYSTWYSVNGGLLVYLWIIAGMFISGGTWALVSMAISVWMPEKLMSIVIPSCIYYLLSMSIFRHLFGWNIPHPSDFYNDTVNWYIAGRSLLEHIIIAAISIAAYVGGIRRRLKNA